MPVFILAHIANIKPQAQHYFGTIRGLARDGEGERQKEPETSLVPWSLCRGSETFTFVRMYPWGSRFCDMQQNTIPNFIKCDNYLLFLFSLSKTRLIVNQYSLEEISNKTDFYTIVLYICCLLYTSDAADETSTV